MQVSDLKHTNTHLASTLGIDDPLDEIGIHLSPDHEPYPATPRNATVFASSGLAPAEVLPYPRATVMTSVEVLTVEIFNCSPPLEPIARIPLASRPLASLTVSDVAPALAPPGTVARLRSITLAQ